ncbi:Transcriptional regulatory protein GlrR [Fundidesulfovibrio magnetotacticus]|uniref:Transcriptional regulatory protein GlrR n=1 Tax=Fundidesulfovibrio magnetotacticus TaxID=2730080 RepID=A0A6V8LSD0_9BACT|nr:sigma-54 dependent transcriptional regulator [Fundidesulfovibrio magnetotacticus]GFK93218.1 Transcriptional regulatory protein GlrR [Fundidesulfovibrio magnetotacticus]
MTEDFSSDAILVVDDEATFAKGIARLLQKGFPAHTVLVRDSAAKALEALQERPCALMITDVRMPGQDGFALLEQALTVAPALTVVMLTGYGSVEAAVKALKSGAYDFLAKPVDQDVLFRCVARALDRAALMRENRRLRQAAGACPRGQSIIGESPAMRRLLGEIQAVAQNDYTVLIQGESGSGKELVARTIHALSRRGANTMVSLNCTAVPEHLLESELFGHVKGAFTGAAQARQGLFLAADGSTLHLDEIGDMPTHVQPKLLRALQEKEVRPVGGSEAIRVDARILASTNRRLEARMAAGEFREDLYYRLNVLTLHVPPLRERSQDIPLLARHFLARTCEELETGEKELTPDALDFIKARNWPGNVRELLNFVRRAAVFSSGPYITEAQVRLLDAQAKNPGAATGYGNYLEAKERVLDDFTRSYVLGLMERTRGNVTQAARLSGLERVSLQKILKRLGVDAARFRPAGEYADE